MPNINWKEFVKFLEKDEILKSFIDSWKRNHRLVIEAEKQRDKIEEAEYQSILRAALKSRLPYDNEIRTRIGQLFNQFLYEIFVQETGDMVLSEIGDEEIENELSKSRSERKGEK